VIFRQIIHDDLGCASYLVGDERAGVAAVFDPRLEVGEYLELARYMGVQITDVFETHNHADHVSGHGRLAVATGARIHIHRLVGPDFGHEPFEHGDEWSLGAVRIRALHTPGHRPEHTAFVLSDTRRGEEPWAVLTGDTLFVGDVARPDLAVEKTEGARGIFHSLQALLALPDDVEVWPGHLGGSMCGGPGIDMKVASTVGFERAHNPMLALDDENEFVAASLAALGPQPPNFRAIVDLNHGPLLTEPTVVPALAVFELLEARDAGAMLIDLRPDAEFAAGHIPGSVSIPMARAGFGTKLAWVAADAEAIVFVGDGGFAADDGRRAATLAAAVGFAGRVGAGGYLEGGIGAWAAADEPLEVLRRVPVDDLPSLLAERPEIQVLDVREHADWQVSHIPGSVCVPWHDVTGVPAPFDGQLPIAVICGSGQRAGVAASLLQRFGASEVLHITDGGVPKWGRLGNPLRSGDEELLGAAA
jgi:hydroxyacylglutathione hydrolase